MAAYLSHHQKVLRLYKKSLRHLESWCIFRDKYRFYACLLRARFDENKAEKDMVKATMLLKAGEEEFWSNQHPQPYIFPDSPGGTSYERYECYKVPEWMLDHWHPSEKAMYPDYFSKREQWKKLRLQSWDCPGGPVGGGDSGRRPEDRGPSSGSTRGRPPSTVVAVCDAATREAHVDPALY
uniref:NADH dehydrogenase [ubiquinone] 1 beta subcomplex subunit 9 n=1 Tax=Neogobius melanostomus TaxID=47308 RepID=A0A8C6TU45_9GOBI